LQSKKDMPISTNDLDEFTVSLEQTEDFEFRVRFDSPQLQEWLMDEPAPLGHNAGPSAARLLAAAIGNCLSTSLVFCAGKARIRLGPLRTSIRTQFARNEQGRLRIGRVLVEIQPSMSEDELLKAQRCLGLFQDYCVVTESIRQGIEVKVTVGGRDPGPNGTK
jgi:uncharacterized OsmC-like protein